MGSVGQGGSVGPAKTRSRFFGFLAPNRALRCTENPRVDGSIPSLATTFNGCVPVTWLTIYSEDMVNTVSGANGLGPSSTRSDPVTHPQDGHPAITDPWGPLSAGGRQLIAVDRQATKAYYVGQMTYQKGR